MSKPYLTEQDINDIIIHLESYHHLFSNLQLAFIREVLIAYLGVMRTSNDPGVIKEEEDKMMARFRTHPELNLSPHALDVLEDRIRLKMRPHGFFGSPKSIYDNPEAPSGKK